MKYGGLLSNVPRQVVFAICRICRVVYQDDNVSSGTVSCPKCKSALERGITKEKARESLDAEYKELLS